MQENMVRRCTGLDRRVQDRRFTGPRVREYIPRQRIPFRDKAIFRPHLQPTPQRVNGLMVISRVSTALQSKNSRQIGRLHCPDQ